MRSSRLSLWSLAGLFFVCGASITAYQIAVLGLPVLPSEGEEIWIVEARIEFRAEGGRPVLARFLVPELRGEFSELSEDFVSRNYGVSLEAAAPNRRVLWSVRRATGAQALYYRIALGRRIGVAAPDDRSPAAVRPPALEGAEQVAVRALLEEVRAHSADISTFSRETLRRLNARNDENARVLRGRSADDLDIARAALLVLHSARIPAQILHALPLRPGSRVRPEVLLASHNGEQWLYYAPSTGRPVRPDTVLIWWEGDEPLLDVEGGRQESVSFSIQKKPVAALALAGEIGQRRSSPWIEFSLLGLPLQTQQLYEVLFTIPVGVAIIVLLRVFIGIETFGTFMPALIALAFRETQLLWGILLFLLLVTIGMVIRAALDHLKLLLISRLSVMLTFVVLIMAGISVFSHRLGLDNGLSVALFPMVIIAMTIERMSITWEERGGPRAILVAAGSLLAASVSYLAMSDPRVTHIAVTFPGSLLMLIGILLVLGSYRGYRLNELLRFRAFDRRT
jgi:hypothetical protein